MKCGLRGILQDPADWHTQAPGRAVKVGDVLEVLYEPVPYCFGMLTGKKKSYRVMSKDFEAWTGRKYEALTLASMPLTATKPTQHLNMSTTSLQCIDVLESERAYFHKKHFVLVYATQDNDFLPISFRIDKQSGRLTMPSNGLGSLL